MKFYLPKIAEELEFVWNSSEYIRLSSHVTCVYPFETLVCLIFGYSYGNVYFIVVFWRKLVYFWV